MTALLWGLPADPTLASVHAELARLGVPILLLDQRDVLSVGVELEISARVEGCLFVAGAKTDLADITAVYLRPHDSSKVRSVRRTAPGSAQRWHARDVDDALTGWADLTPAYVVSRPSAAASNGSKPYQLSAVAAAGFAIPETLVSNDPEAVESFVRRHGVVIYKSVSAIRSRVRRLDGAELRPSRLADIATCPTQFQRWVAGVDVRVHVVGTQVFATRIICAADDYRYATEQGMPRARLVPTELPDELARRCRDLASLLRLPVAGIDLRVDPDGVWYCFEVNPSPAFAYYEAGTGQPIAAAVAGLLAAAVTCAGVA